MSSFTALSFLTIIPRPFRGEVSTREIGRSLSYFSVVGVALGLFLAGLRWLSALQLEKREKESFSKAGIYQSLHSRK